MKITLGNIWPEEKPAEERFKEGANVKDGVAGSVKIDKEWYVEANRKRQGTVQHD